MHKYHLTLDVTVPEKIPLLIRGEGPLKPRYRSSGYHKAFTISGHFQKMKLQIYYTLNPHICQWSQKKPKNFEKS
jgi:hypothetical protein